MTKLKVSGMTCGHCEMSVTKALSAVSGVSRVVDVSHQRQEALVEGEAKVEDLIAAVKDVGYEAEAAA